MKVDRADHFPLHRKHLLGFKSNHRGVKQLRAMVPLSRCQHHTGCRTVVMIIEGPTPLSSNEGVTQLPGHAHVPMTPFIPMSLISSTENGVIEGIMHHIN